MSTGKPRGFRDILFAEAARREQLTMKLSNYFSQQGYLLVETPTVEYPETLERGGSESDAFRFVDIDGNLIALRSDVTGSLARVVATRFSKIDPPYRLRYVADVFREKESLRGSDRQMTQIGIECFGLAAQEADAEVLSLALGGLQTVGLSEVYLHLSDVSLIGKLIEQSFAAGDTELIMQAWRDGDFIRFKDLMKAANLSGSCVDRRKLITSLLKLSGDESALDAAAQLLDQNQEARDALENLRACYRSLVERFPTQKVVIDFSLPPRLDYYSGIIFELNVATAQGRSRCVGSGGRYDTLLARFGRDLPAVGFVYELTQLEALIESFEQAPEIADTTLHPLRIAIPKGKLFDDSVALLKAVGVDIPGLDNPGRTLSFSTPDYEVIIAKPTDVAIYVSSGVVDIGMSGRDTLVEADFPLLQLLDLRYGGCEFVVAAPADMEEDLADLSLRLGTVRVATKYPRLTQRYFDQQGIQIEMVKLNGNIELAPLIGIADLIVDLAQTGTTLRENNLIIKARVLESTAQLVAQYSAARTDGRVLDFAQKLEAIIDRTDLGEEG